MSSTDKTLFGDGKTLRRVNKAIESVPNFICDLKAVAWERRTVDNLPGSQLGLRTWKVLKIVLEPPE
jgi:hypothetical protein